MSTFKKFSISSIFVELFPSKRTKMFFGKISTYTCIQALKCRMQALFLMKNQNLRLDFRDFDFLLFLGIKSESNQFIRWKTEQIALNRNSAVTLIFHYLLGHPSNNCFCFIAWTIIVVLARRTSFDIEIFWLKYISLNEIQILNFKMIEDEIRNAMTHYLWVINYYSRLFCHLCRYIQY